MGIRLVLDCSVAAKWVLPAEDRGKALVLMERWEAGEITVIAPDLLLAEFASLLAKRCRRKQLSAAQVREAFQLMKRCAPRLYPMRLLMEEALELSLAHQLSLWDGVYLALAVQHNCELITADARLVRGGNRHQAIRLLV